MRRTVTDEWHRQAGLAVVAYQPQPHDQHQQHQALLAHKAATLAVVLSQLHDTNSFRQIGELIGRSDEWVRLRLIPHPDLLYRVGKQWLVPRGVAEAFIKSVLV